MSGLRPLQSLQAPNAEPLDARQVAQRRSMVVVLAVALGFSLLVVMGTAGLLVFRGSRDTRPLTAVGVEAHLNRTGFKTSVKITKTRESYASWGALVYVASASGEKIGTLTRYIDEKHAVSESARYCGLAWNTCVRTGTLVLNIREDTWSKTDPERAKMLAAFASFRETSKE